MEEEKLQEPGVKLSMEDVTFGPDDSLTVSCRVAEVFTSVRHKVGTKEVYGSTRLEPNLHVNILMTKMRKEMEESQSGLPIIGEIFRRATAELDLQCAKLLIEHDNQTFKNPPAVKIQRKETF